MACSHNQSLLNILETFKENILLCLVLHEHHSKEYLLVLRHITENRYHNDNTDMTMLMLVGEPDETLLHLLTRVSHVFYDCGYS